MSGRLQSRETVLIFSSKSGTPEMIAGRELDMMDWVDRLSWEIIIILCLTLGLAPYMPPHIWEKLQWLFQGELHRPIDWFDLVLHSIPWVLLGLKIGRWLFLIAAR